MVEPPPSYEQSAAPPYLQQQSFSQQPSQNFPQPQVQTLPSPQHFPPQQHFRPPQQQPFFQQQQMYPQQQPQYPPQQFQPQPQPGQPFSHSPYPPQPQHVFSSGHAPPQRPLQLYHAPASVQQIPPQYAMPHQQPQQHHQPQQHPFQSQQSHYPPQQQFGAQPQQPYQPYSAGQGHPYPHGQQPIIVQKHQPNPQPTQQQQGNPQICQTDIMSSVNDLIAAATQNPSALSANMANLNLQMKSLPPTNSDSSNQQKSEKAKASSPKDSNLEEDFDKPRDSQSSRLSMFSSAMGGIKKIIPGATPTAEGHWVDDKDAASCMRCDVRFTIFVRRHHCRLCGYVVCSKCSARKAPKDLLWVKTSPFLSEEDAACIVSSKEQLRVCEPCFNGLADPSVSNSQNSLLAEESKENLSPDELKSLVLRGFYAVEKKHLCRNHLNDRLPDGQTCLDLEVSSPEEEEALCSDDTMDHLVVTFASKSFLFRSVGPKAFCRIRHKFGQSRTNYLKSFDPETTKLGGGGTGAGKSGQFFFFSQDKRFLLKTTTTEEFELFQSILLQPYHQHMLNHPHSLLPRFFGLYQFEYFDQNISFVCMTNIFDVPHSITLRYDLKGSTLGRAASKKEKEKSEPILKDLDWLESEAKVCLGKEAKMLFMLQVTKDVEFLKSFNIMDYSLLLGVSPASTRAVTPPMMSFNEVVKQLELSRSNSDRNMFQQFEGGFMGTNGDVYMFAIIDVLQQYNLQKQSERGLKKIAFSGKSISSMDSVNYASRYIAFMDSISE